MRPTNKKIKPVTAGQNIPLKLPVDPEKAAPYLDILNRMPNRNKFILECILLYEQNKRAKDILTFLQGQSLPIATNDVKVEATPPIHQSIPDPEPAPESTPSTSLDTPPPRGRRDRNSAM